MRNPLNSIYGQNLKQKQINDKLKDLIEKDFTLLSARKLKKCLISIRMEHKESIGIQRSSTKLINYLVNDILDFAQLKSGKFRKDISKFDIRESIQEIIDV